jgi:hypothetical protein
VHLLQRWKWWALINSVRMLVYTYTVVYMHLYKEWLHEDQNHRSLVGLATIHTYLPATYLPGDPIRASSHPIGFIFPDR